MADTSKLILAIVEATPPLRIYVEQSADAVQVANLTGCRVRIEQIYTPESRRGKRSAPSNGAASPVPVVPPAHAPEPATATALPALTAGTPSLPEQVRQRINAHPERAYRAGDFLDLGDKKSINSILFRSVKQKQIERVSGKRGAFRALRGAPPPATPAQGATAKPKIIAFMQQHAGEWLRAADVTAGMKLDDDRKGAVAAALGRLAPTPLQKKGGMYCFPASTRQGVQH